ncbi:HAD family hydrolase [Sulfoacidibacillus thermotolerans]|uniref:ATPase P n=1 Tax=Sulfoacidibacillus thermotolerans TaxID=1765684 RepID=A0A2U3D7X8_SULT2|nr:HAD hydrolase family protein [Sulfoacidibacillus thermotolerans]PWI57386.1 ATPase P [Sulfoacidibacillus thermotolerans]
MLEVNIPGREVWRLDVLLLDYNGTIACDGKLLPGVEHSILKLSTTFAIYIVTADTFGSVAKMCADLPVHIHRLTSVDHTKEKADYLLQFDPKRVVAIGNGRNDAAMLQTAQLGIAVMGNEGCAVQTLLAADLVVQSIHDAFSVLEHPNRLIASLRS